jgi:hypothetical protein
MRHDALTYGAGWGWPVFPLAPGDKRPQAPRCHAAVDGEGNRLTGARLAEHATGCTGDGHGYLDATTDPDRIIDWWERWPEANIGLATGAASGVLALDLDPPAGGETLEALAAIHGTLPRAVGVWTPRGGLHAFYRHPGGHVPCSAGKLGPNLDVRGDGGYLVAGWSVVAGRTYTWRDDPYPGPPVLPELPAEWVELLTAPARQTSLDVRPAGFVAPFGGTANGAYVLAAVRGEVEAVATAAPGTRNVRLNQAAFRLGTLAAAGVVDVNAARVALLAAADAAGLAAHEARATTESGLSAGLSEPATLTQDAA